MDGWMEKINVEAATPAGASITPLPYIYTS